MFVQLTKSKVTFESRKDLIGENTVLMSVVGEWHHTVTLKHSSVVCVMGGPTAQMWHREDPEGNRSAVG